MSFPKLNQEKQTYYMIIVFITGIIEVNRAGEPEERDPRTPGTQHVPERYLFPRTAARQPLLTAFAADYLGRAHETLVAVLAIGIHPDPYVTDVNMAPRYEWTDLFPGLPVPRQMAVYPPRMDRQGRVRHGGIRKADRYLSSPDGESLKARFIPKNIKKQPIRQGTNA